MSAFQGLEAQLDGEHGGGVAFIEGRVGELRG